VQHNDRKSHYNCVGRMVSKATRDVCSWLKVCVCGLVPLCIEPSFMRSDALRISSLCHLNAMSGPFASGSFLLAHGPWSLVSTTCARGVSAHTHVCA
jgi:hypothetical protein